MRSIKETRAPSALSDFVHPGDKTQCERVGRRQKVSAGGVINFITQRSFIKWKLGGGECSAGPPSIGRDRSPNDSRLHCSRVFLITMDN